MAKKLGDEIRRMVLPFEVKAVKESSDGRHAGEFTGYAAGIHNIDRVGDMILPGAFTDDLPRFLAEGVVCWQHDWMTPIGVPLEAFEDTFGLLTRARVSNTAQGKDAMTLIKDGVVKKLSIGYRAQTYEWVNRAGLIAYLATTNLSEQRRQEIIRTYDEFELDECFLLKKLKLYEFSPVTVPANPNANIITAKNLLTGLTFADHSKAVLTAVQGLTERVRGINTLREQQQRKANPIHAQICDEIAQELALIADDLEGIAIAIRQTDQPKTDEAARIFAEFQLIEARQLGVAA